MVKQTKPRLLIVEDDEGLQTQLEWALGAYSVVVVGDRASALIAMKKHRPAVVTLDLGLPPDPDGTTEGLATLRAIMLTAPDTKVIIASGHEGRESAQSAIALGAFDFYSKPIIVNDLKLIISRAFHIHQIEQENAQQPSDSTAIAGIMTGSPQMAEVLRAVRKVANADASVMILGASGTGKELIANAIHDRSARAGQNFVAINCAAIPEGLLESELFGYEKGAFTGAIKSTVGKIEMAQGGTLFLDEIGDVPYSTQVKLLRFLQERVIERVGGRRQIPIDTRVVTATHQNIKQMMVDGTFREDLYFRLAEITVKMPTLAEREGDAALLANHFLKRYRAGRQTSAKGFTLEALAAIDAWSWPGNVRELENRVKRAAIMTEESLITMADLDLDIDVTPVHRTELRIAREHADRAAIIAALTANNGNMSAAARDLDISRPMLYDLINSYGISKN